MAINAPNGMRDALINTFIDNDCIFEEIADRLLPATDEEAVILADLALRVFAQFKE